MELNKQEIKELLEDLIKDYNDIEEFYVFTDKYFGYTFQHKLGDILNSLFEYKLNDICDKIGDVRYCGGFCNNTWIEWFIYENNLGKNKFEATIATDGKEIEYIIDNLDSFIDFFILWRDSNN